MELEAASRQARLVRMDDHDRVSQASSVATISYFPMVKESDGKVQTFGKRCQSAKRDPNCPVVIRGWLNKKDSSGLKLWKRRWFVLSNYCLFYYKDSREESVLGSIPLPSYKILFCTPRECKNRKFTFKVVHQGMRSYFFSADTQEDMLGWVRALSQSAAMEPDSSMNRRCSSYHDFTQIGGSSESVDLPKSPSDDEGLSQKHRHVSRTLSEPSKLSGGRMGRSHSEQRERRSMHQRNSRTPSPDLSRRRACGPNKEEDYFPGQNAPSQTDVMATGSLTSRGQLGSRPHTPVGRVDIRPHDDLVMLPHTLYYAPASPNLEFKSNPSTPGSERWQSLNKPPPVYGSVHHSSGRRPLGKAPKPDPREMPPLRPLESDADAVLTRLCGCDKLLQSLSVELAQLQMDKDNVQCALEVSRLQLEEWKSHGPQAHEEALTEKALLQEELVTVRARMCDVSLEMERVWCQYERMESELSVVRSQLQHICNFGMPQEQSQAQRELWMMEDILDGLKSNRSHFRYLLGIQRHHLFQSTAPHPGSPGSPTECLPVDVEEEPPVRPPLPQELQESQSRNMSHGWAESPYEAIYSHTVDPVHRRGNSQPDLLNVKAHRDPSDSQSGSKWIPPDTTNQSTKKLKMKMSEEEQIERMKRNQERVTNRKKPPVPAPGAQTQGQSSEPKAEAPFPLRVTRVVTAVLPSSLVARRVSVEDPPAELDTPLAEQIPSEKQPNLAEQGKKLLSKPPRRPLLENPDQNWSSAEMDQDQPIKKTYKNQHQGASRTSTKELRSEVSRTEGLETSSNQIRDDAGLENGSASSNIRKVEQSTALLTSNMDYDLCLTPEQREAKLRRVERIRERVIRSAVRESATTHSQLSVMGKEKEVHHDAARKQRLKAGHDCHDGRGSCGDNLRSSAELQLSSAISEDKEKEHQELNNQAKLENRTQHSGRPGVAKSKIKRPASPYHISSMTVYPKDGGKGFIGLKDDEQKKIEENPDGDDNESDSKASDLRAKWFLSTNQWKGFIPLQIPATETLCNEEAADNQAASSDDITDSNEMLSAVSESLEKMKENHSLFYKIACDISISDSDITKNDGNSCAQTSSGPEEKEPLLITESVPADAASNVGPSSEQENKDVTQPMSSNGNESSETADSKPRDSTVELQEKATKDASVFEKSAANECEDNSRSESQLKVKETTGRVCIGDTDPIQTLDGSASQTREERSGTKESGDRKDGRVRSEELKKSASLCEEKNENVPEQGNKSAAALSSSVREAGRVIRSASFGKARVTVLRTSL
ncbi:pleckstrin homology domain-containing family A member 4 isoform X3 [Oreochromis niloticus]|uniref:pleckstrin homology domain-containing family A member 4 isoform X3 n=1 Tax=Oreochromis niloticus TaxID=8128 RepID=UPI0003945A85|nr:pleckstrin homology domain-containing family A member 6 isoform X3 [Oreochromis niloticus]